MNDDDFKSSGAMRLIAHRLGEVETTMKALAESVDTLVVIQERLTHYAEAQRLIFKELEKLQGRVASLEAKMPDADRAGRWLDRGLWAAVAAIAVYIAKKTGLI